MVSKVPPVWLKLMPKPAWVALGLLQALFALGLVLPGAMKVLPKLTPIAAVGVAVETVLVSMMTGVKFPGILWAGLPALLALFVAYGRLVLSPF